MAIIINEKYKEIIKEINSYQLSPFNKAVLVLEEMDNMKTKDNDNVFDDYTTMAKAVIETYLGKEISI